MFLERWEGLRKPIVCSNDVEKQQPGLLTIAQQKSIWQRVMLWIISDQTNPQLAAWWSTFFTTLHTLSKNLLWGTYSSRHVTLLWISKHLFDPQTIKPAQHCNEHHQAPRRVVEEHKCPGPAISRRHPSTRARSGARTGKKRVAPPRALFQLAAPHRHITHRAPTAQTSTHFRETSQRQRRIRRQKTNIMTKLTAQPPNVNTHVHQ